MRLLLDSQAAYWWLLDDKRLSRPAYKAISDPENEPHASVIAVYEIGLKVQRGRLNDDIARGLRRLLVREGLGPLPLTIDHMERGALLDWRHGDPWDRLLAAQAMIEGMTLVSADKAFDALPLRRLW